MDINKRRILLKSFITSQCSYFRLIRMFHRKNMENRINRNYKRVLRLAYDDRQDLPFSDSLVKASPSTKQISTFSLQKYTKQDISPEISSDLFLFMQEP